MTFRSAELPRLDCHAHVAPDVTTRQVSALGDAFVFAVTRSLAEAARVPLQSVSRLIWGCGVHPRLPPAVADYSESRFRELAKRFLLIGEIGLDRRSGNLIEQTRVLESILRVVADQPVLTSFHSSGCADEVVSLVEAHQPRGAILHWFTGDTDLIARATAAGCAFSVNGAMSDGQLLALPQTRVLPETDFPAAGAKRAGSKPGDTTALERRLAALWNKSDAEVRVQFFRNLREHVTRAGALDRLPDELADTIIRV